MFATLLRKIKQLFNLFLDWLSPKRRKPAGIVAEAEQALQDWKYARVVMNHADSEMIDYAIYNFNASEKRFIGLLQKAREAGLTAWEWERSEQN